MSDGLCRSTTGTLRSLEESDDRLRFNAVESDWASADTIGRRTHDGVWLRETEREIRNGDGELTAIRNLGYHWLLLSLIGVIWMFCGIIVSLTYRVEYSAGTVSYGITPRCVSFGSTRLICGSDGITRLVCGSDGTTRLICVSDMITRLLCCKVLLNR
ncbi:hypothetical protein E6C27_scaffold1735G00130 [Cucumis melo var. makuwa]|uniref:Uncharacterized protein n=1 Tax=Cucumis melo var. makuwa TaxID=1194695 RepID=A0A5A7ST75_CUCMM|nr:hypothetical protein E6C27_scaffold1735G00130 [Cucumis melo var. makuwa]